jgi:NodT family efflux transporter outer membrane factor (OMF) lipoprotein
MLVGEPASTFSLKVMVSQARPPAVPAGIPSELLERRPDIAGAERTMAQANAQIRVAKAAFYPTLTLSATGGFGNSSFTDWLTWPSRFWSVGPTVAQSVFDAGLRKATVQQYRAGFDLAVANYRETVLTAFQQVEDNLAALRILSQVVEQQDAAVHAAQRNLDVAMVRYRAGLDPYLNVVIAQTTLLFDRQAYVGYRTLQMEASVQLIKALGGGWDVSQMPSPKKVSGK